MVDRVANVLAKRSVSERTVREWLSRVDKDSKEARNKRIFDMWLACHTQQEIADAVGWSQPAVKAEIDTFISFADSGKIDKSAQNAANHETEFEVPIYNVWKQQSKSEGSTHFGNSEVRWVDSLLYLYTKPFDVVIDPFAGGGSTIDICKKRFRRYFVSDRKPIIEREKEIRKHDLKDGPLKPPQWKDVKLVYLNPPYWIQAQGQYSDDADDLGNQSLEYFTSNLVATINQYAKKISDAYIAMIIQPTQWKAPERQFVDHIGDMLRAVKLPVDMRYSVPYESQQCNAQMVEWSKENKRFIHERFRINGVQFWHLPSFRSNLPHQDHPAGYQCFSLQPAEASLRIVNRSCSISDSRRSLYSSIMKSV